MEVRPRHTNEQDIVHRSLHAAFDTILSIYAKLVEAISFQYRGTNMTELQNFLQYLYEATKLDLRIHEEALALFKTSVVHERI